MYKESSTDFGTQQVQIACYVLFLILQTYFLREFRDKMWSDSQILQIKQM